jgi:hypothetical protein
MHDTTSFLSRHVSAHHIVKACSSRKAERQADQLLLRGVSAFLWARCSCSSNASAVGATLRTTTALELRHVLLHHSVAEEADACLVSPWATWTMQNHKFTATPEMHAKALACMLLLAKKGISGDLARHVVSYLFH